MTDRPLHPDDREDVFQHPIKGCVYRELDRMWCCVEDYNQGEHPDDILVYVGVEVFRSRCELGAWLTERHPDDKHKILNHLFVEAMFPIKFEDEESAETQASLQRVDMAQDVINAGGACTICAAPNDPDEGVNHIVGCELMSWLMYRIAVTLLEADGEPTLEDVVRSAHEQIERMQ